MVAHPRKTPSPGPIRPVRSKTATAKSTSPKTSDSISEANAAAGPGVRNTRFRPMNLPVPIDVAVDDAERPVSVTLPPAASVRPLGPRRPASYRGSEQKGRKLAVTSIDDLWQVDDEWWRETPISRRYYLITARQITASQLTTQAPITQGDRRLTIFHDQINHQWHWQKGG